MRRFLFVSLMFLALFALVPADHAEGQLYFGGHIAYATGADTDAVDLDPVFDGLDGAVGVGGRIGWDLPVLPVDILAAGEYFFPDCGAEDCAMYGGTLEALVRLPIPLVRPYALGGLVWRSWDAGDEDGSSTGFDAGLGIDLHLLAVRVFLDARYEFLDDPQEQWVLRLGVNF